MAEVTKKSTTIDKLHNIIANDISVSYKLLRFLNSSYFYRLQEIKSVKQAIAYLGIKELRHFVMLVIISEMTTSKPGELVRLGLVRAKFCELLGENSDRSIESSELFVVGLFSLLDAMLDAPMIEIMERLPVSNGIKEALLTDTGPYCIYLELVKNYERNNEALFVPLFERLELDPEKVNTCYLTAIKYANGLL